MPRRTLTLTLLSILIWNSPFGSLCALEIGQSGEANAARAIVSLNLPQNNFSIDSASNLSTDELGAVGNSETTRSIQKPAQLVITPSPFQREGKGEGRRNQSTHTPQPCLHSQSESVPDRLQERHCDPANLLPKGEKELHTLGKKKQVPFLGKQNLSLANLSALSALYDGSVAENQIKFSAGILEPDENDSGILQPHVILPIKTLGTGQPTSRNDGFHEPHSVFVDSKGQIYMTDTWNHRVQILDSSLQYLRTLGTGEHTAGNDGFDYPQSVFVDSKGQIYMADPNNHRIQIFDSSGKYLHTLGTGLATSGNDGFNHPWSVSLDSKGYIYVADTNNHRIQIFDSSLQYLRTLGTGNMTSGNDGFKYPGSVSVDSNGDIYVTDSLNHRIQIFDSSGKYLRTLGTGKETFGNEGFNLPVSVFLDSKGLIYIADAHNHRIQIFDSSGKYLRTLGIGKETSRNGGFNRPQGVSVDSKGLIYVADTNNHRVQIFPSLDEINDVNKKRQKEAEKFLSQKPEIPAVPETSNKEQHLARERFKIIWDDASRFIP